MTSRLKPPSGWICAQSFPPGRIAALRGAVAVVGWCGGKGIVVSKVPRGMRSEC